MGDVRSVWSIRPILDLVVQASCPMALSPAASHFGLEIVGAFAGHPERREGTPSSPVLLSAVKDLGNAIVPWEILRGTQEDTRLRKASP